MNKTDKQVQIKIFGTLTDFLSTEIDGNTSLEVYIELSPSAKDVIEAQGIPHTAVFEIRVNDRKKSLDYNIRPGDTLKIYPFELVDPGEFEVIFSSPSVFIADGHLAKLGRDLRLLGLDTLIEKNSSDPEIIEFSNNEKRMILTRDLELLKNGAARYGYWVRSTNPETQLREILNRFDIGRHLQPFKRCTTCNGLLKEVSLEEVADKVPPKVKEWSNEYRQCNKCGKVYWKGSHYDKLKKKVEWVIEKM